MSQKYTENYLILKTVSKLLLGFHQTNIDSPTLGMITLTVKKHSVQNNLPLAIVSVCLDN